jgi:hypothetical protein
LHPGGRARNATQVELPDGNLQKREESHDDEDDNREAVLEEMGFFHGGGPFLSVG